MVPWDKLEIIKNLKKSRIFSKQFQERSHQKQIGKCF